MLVVVMIRRLVAEVDGSEDHLVCWANVEGWVVAGHLSLWYEKATVWGEEWVSVSGTGIISDSG